MAKNNTAKVFCTCKHEFQDALYGKQIRIANYAKSKSALATSQPVRCTVCNNMQDVKKDA